MCELEYLIYTERGRVSSSMMRATDMRHLAVWFAGLALAVTANAAPLPYDTTQDSNAALQHGMAQARSTGKDVLIVFGANWCEDCRELDRAMHGASAQLIDSRFIVVKIDVGNFDKNLDVTARYGNPIQKGIPAAVVVTPDNRILFSTRAGELANARHLGDQGIYEYFSKALPSPGS
jgi:thioredoxin 1